MSRNSPKKTPGKEPNKDSTKPRYTVPALEKGLAILEFLAADGQGYTQAEIARQLGRSQSEIFRMLTCLEQHGYIGRGLGNEGYRLTSKMFELAHAHPPTARLIDLAMPVMRRFAEQADQSCHLVIHQSNQAIVIAQADSPSFVGVSVRPGRALSLHESVSGHVLAAFAPADVRTHWLNGLEAILSAKRHKELLSTMKRIRSAGHNACPSAIIDGILDISVPVLGHGGDAAAALSVPCLLPGQKQTAFQPTLKMLRQAANEISQAMGCGEKTLTK